VAKTSQNVAEVPVRVATTTPDISTGSAHARDLVEKIEKSIDEIKRDLREYGADRHSDFKYMIAVLGAGFIILGGMLIAGYLRLDDRMDALATKVEALSVTSTRVETKLDDLIARVPPAQAPVPGR
jgi:outer membrane murein-binding lipoprotein Lpp